MSQLSISCRTPNTVEFRSGLPELKIVATESTTASTLEYSPDAARYAVVDADGVTVHDIATRNTILRLDLLAVTAIAFSPKGTFLLTHRRPTKAADGTAERNLVLWNIATGEALLSLHQKSLDRDHWPTVQFTADETMAAHMVTNTVHVYSPSSFAAGPVAKLHVKGLNAFSLGPSSTAPVVAAYVPEAKGSPGFIALFPCPKDASSGEGTPAPISRRSFYRANSVRFLWNSGGEAVLVITAADVDATNQSYYGEQKLFFFAADGSHEAAVALPKEGPIHDVQWSPKGDCFVALAGFMPAKATLFTHKCVPKFDLGSGPYSLVRWNAFGRFFILAGFGNLPGDLAFFDKKADLKCKSMGTSRAENGVTLQWSPCGRYILASTIAPRLRVDNGIQVFKYDGTLVARLKHDVLLDAQWLPAPEGSYEDRPQSPKAAGAAGNGSAHGAAAALPPQPTRAAGYVPPHFRNNPGAAAAAKASFSLARDEGDKGGRIKPGAVSARAGPPGMNLPPGAAPESKAASKNAKRRSKKKAPGDAVEGVAALKI